MHDIVTHKKLRSSVFFVVSLSGDSSFFLWRVNHFFTFQLFVKTDFYFKKSCHNFDHFKYFSSSLEIKTSKVLWAFMRKCIKIKKKTFFSFSAQNYGVKNLLKKVILRSEKRGGVVAFWSRKTFFSFFKIRFYFRNDHF